MQFLKISSVVLWAAALSFSPAPASAGYGKYGTNVQYFACAQFSLISEKSCCIGEIDVETKTCMGTQYYFSGKMTHTVPISACAGACGGAESLYVNWPASNGRYANTSYPNNLGNCLNGNIFYIAPCSTCQ